MAGIQVEIPHEAIAQIAREVFEQLSEERAEHDAEALETHQKFERLMAKPFWSITEVAFAFGCSENHIRNLLQRAHDGATKYPIPHCNLDGLIMFERDPVLAWARQDKPLIAGKRKSGGKKHRHLKAVVNQ